MALERLRDIVTLGLGFDISSVDHLSGFFGSVKVDGKGFVLPHGPTYFQGYEVRNVPPFLSPQDIESFLQALGERASVLGFDVLKIDKQTGPSDNGHYGLLPNTHYDYSGRLELQSREVPSGKLARDTWEILVGDTGEVDSTYGRFGRSPILAPGLRRFMGEIALARILPLPTTVA